MPRARSASAIRGSSEGGNGARTGGRGAKWRVAVMHGPVVGEVSRSSRIRPSIGPTLSRPADPPRRLLQDRRVRLRVEADQPRAPGAGVLGLSAGAASAEQTSRVLLTLLRWLLPGAPPEQLAALHGLLRKAGHVAEYATLALLWFRAFRRGRGLAPRASAWLALGASLAWAFVDEWHQSALLARTG